METKKIEDTFELGIKRCYLPVELYVDCPYCGEEMEIEMNGVDYLSYPVVNEKEQFTGTCEHCDEIYSLPVTIRMSVDYYPEEIRKDY